MIIRQGDILFTRIDGIPTGATPVADRIIARGETTGHAHRLRAGRGRSLLAIGTVMYIHARYQAHVDHEEHSTVTLPMGDYKITRQREYEPTGWRQVQD
jgi:hypothetical protein